MVDCENSQCIANPDAMTDAELTIELERCDVCGVYDSETLTFRLGFLCHHIEVATRGPFAACDGCQRETYNSTTARRRGAPHYQLGQGGAVLRASKRRAPLSVPEHVAVIARLACQARPRLR